MCSSPSRNEETKSMEGASLFLLGSVFFVASLYAWKFDSANAHSGKMYYYGQMRVLKICAVMFLDRTITPSPFLLAFVEFFLTTRGRNMKPEKSLPRLDHVRWDSSIKSAHIDTTVYTKSGHFKWVANENEIQLSIHVYIAPCNSYKCFKSTVLFTSLQLLKSAL